MAGEKIRLDEYLDTINRIEPSITAIDVDAGVASIAISLRRIADTLERIETTLTIATNTRATK